MAACAYWNERFNAGNVAYSCPWCDRDLKPKVSNSAKNPGKNFVSCSRDYGGCGLFSFLDSQPNEKFKPKRARTEGGTNVIGEIANRPGVTDERLADLAAKIDELASQIGSLSESLRQTHAEVMEYLKQ